MALYTFALSPTANAPQHLLDRHFRRKHGSRAYYGNPDAAFTTPASDVR
jgi:L-ribulose-5-phosphate 4-epimerase